MERGSGSRGVTPISIDGIGRTSASSVSPEAKSDEDGQSRRLHFSCGRGRVAHVVAAAADLAGDGGGGDDDDAVSRAPSS